MLKHDTQALTEHIQHAKYVLPEAPSQADIGGNLNMHATGNPPLASASPTVKYIFVNKFNTPLLWQ